MKLRQFWDKILNVLFPEKITCISCGSEIFEENEKWLCDRCKIELNDKDICLRCGTPMNNQASYCEDCKNSTAFYTSARTALIYIGTAKKLIQGYKYGGQKYLYQPFAAFMKDAYERYKLKADVVVPAPIAKKRRQKRGFNQAELLAREIADFFKLEYKDILIKTKDTPYQARLTRDERFKQVEGIFDIISDSGIKDKTILLIDDVITTGATINELSKILKKAGAKEVFVLGLAQTPKRIKGLN